MSAYSFEPRAPTTRGGGGGSPSIPPLLTVVPIYSESTTPTDGATMTFPFAVPIVSLITGFVGGQAQSPADCSVVAGALVLGFAPGDAANVGLIKVGALYLR